VGNFTYTQGNIGKQKIDTTSQKVGNLRYTSGNLSVPGIDPNPWGMNNEPCPDEESR